MDIKTLVRKPDTYLGIASLQAIVATLGSLYFSNIVLYEPCMLCWWQRIFMYPLAFILTIAYFRKDFAVLFYAVPLLLVGLAFSLYHNTIYFISMYERLQPDYTFTACSPNGPSCTAIYIEWFGFITIPFLALVAFLVIGFCLGMVWKLSRSK